MLLRDRRHAILVIALVAVTVTWLIPLIFLVSPQTRDLSPFNVFVVMFTAQLLWLLSAELLSRLPFRETGFRRVVGLLILLSSWIAVYVAAYRHLPFGETGWMGLAWRNLFVFDGGLSIELAAILINALLWQRAFSFANRAYRYQVSALAVRFGWGMLLLGVIALAHFTGKQTANLFWITFPSGLVTLILGRMEDDPLTSSATPQLSWLRMAQFFTVVIVVVGIGLGIAAVFTPARFAAFVGFVRPFFEAALSLASRILVALAYVLYPIIFVFFQVVAWLRRLLPQDTELPSPELWQPEFPEIEQPEGPGGGVLPLWANYGLRIGALLLVLVGVMFFVRVVRPRRARTDAMEESETVQPGSGDFLRRGWQQLKDAVALARRVGVNRQLLATISVQNIYANLCRIGARRGRPRQPSQPPDAYLPTLIIVFDGYEAALRHITQVYMRVHYGDYAISRDELKRVQAAYAEIRAGMRKDTREGVEEA